MRLLIYSDAMFTCIGYTTFSGNQTKISEIWQIGQHPTLQ